MTPERRERIRDVLEKALKLPREQQAAFLQRECSSDASLREAVEMLLFASPSVRSAFLDPPSEPAVTFSGSVLAAGSKLGPYVVQALLGAGGMGEVYRARDTRLDRTVAIKVILHARSGDLQRRQRFEREARAISALQHPNICTLYDVGSQDGTDYLVMEYLEGETLSARLQRGRLPLDLTLRYATEVADALEAAHRRGIIHRDLKPGNIFIMARGESKVLDFGLAKLDDSHPSSEALIDAETAPEVLTTPGIAMGTVAYMSPEQARGEDLDGRTDIFSLGAVIYEMATGKIAFPGKTSAIVFKLILDETPPTPSKVAPSLPGQLDQIVEKALEKDRDLRYQSAGDLRADINRLKRDTTSGRVAAKKYDAPAARSRKSWGLAACAVVLLLVATGLGVRWWVARKTVSAPGQIIQRQLTASGPDNRVTGFALSGDGKYLAYQDQKGIFIEEIETGESHKVEGTDGLYLCDWYTDGVHMLVADSQAMWMLFTPTGQKRQLASPAACGGLSWDTSQAMFFRQGAAGSELWTMPSQGGDPQMRFALKKNEYFAAAGWGPDAKSVTYIRAENSFAHVTLETRVFDEKEPTVLVSDPELALGGEAASAAMWLPDGRVLFALHNPSKHAQSDVWTIPVDAKGRTTGDKVRVTNTIGSYVWGMSGSADGKRLAVGFGRHPFEAYMADLNRAGDKLENPRRLINDSWDNWPSGWTIDGKTLFYTSERNTLGAYEYSLSSNSSESFLGGTTKYVSPTPTPDGKWVLLVNRVSQEKRSISRAPVAGGLVEVIAEQKGQTNVLCSSPPSDICIATELVGKQCVIRRLDPIKGVQEELGRLDITNDEQVYSALSPDGSKIAVIEAWAENLRVLDLKTKKVEVIHPNPPQQKIQTSAWSSDGKHLFVTAFPFVNGALHGRILLMDMEGHNHVLLENPYGWIGQPVPSPDGKRIAFPYVVQESNVTLFEHF